MLPAIIVVLLILGVYGLFSLYGKFQALKASIQYDASAFMRQIDSELALGDEELETIIKKGVYCSIQEIFTRETEQVKDQETKDFSKDLEYIADTFSKKTANFPIQVAAMLYGQFVNEFLYRRNAPILARKDLKMLKWGVDNLSFVADSLGVRLKGEGELIGEGIVFHHKS